MQGAGEQQETQHAVQQGLIEIDAGQHKLNIMFKLDTEGLKQVQYQRKNQCYQHDADHGG